jgi:hypothetical protein
MQRPNTYNVVADDNVQSSGANLLGNSHSYQENHVGDIKLFAESVLQSI